MIATTIGRLPLAIGASTVEAHAQVGVFRTAFQFHIGARCGRAQLLHHGVHEDLALAVPTHVDIAPGIVDDDLGGSRCQRVAQIHTLYASLYRRVNGQACTGSQRQQTSCTDAPANAGDCPSPGTVRFMQSFTQADASTTGIHGSAALTIHRVRIWNTFAALKPFVTAAGAGHRAFGPAGRIIATCVK